MKKIWYVTLFFLFVLIFIPIFRCWNIFQQKNHFWILHKNEVMALFDVISIFSLGLSFLCLNLIKRTEEAETWRNLLDTIPQIVWTTDIDGTCDYLNPQWKEYTGVSGLGYDWLLSVHPDDKERAQTSWMNAVQNCDTIEIEYRLRNKNGKYRWFLIKGYLTPFQNSKKWVGTLTDINDKKIRRDQEVEIWRNNAARKDEFLAMLAHELRNPISVIANGVQFLDVMAKEKTICKECPGSNARIMMLRQTKHLTRLVDDLLDMSRINKGKIVLCWKTMDISEPIITATEIANLSINEKKQQLKLNYEIGKIKINGDTTRLSQVFANLLTNASKYTQVEGVIELSVIDDVDKVIVKIKDNGIGIAPENIVRIFDLFTQVDNSLDRSQGGLGIGLTLCKNIIKMHNGSIKATSEGLGKGSEFTVIVPTTNKELIKEVKMNNLSKKCTILVVDDILDSANSMSELLKIQGHKVFTANNGEVALKFVSEVKPNVVLLDIGLPIMNGYEIAQRIRQMPEGKDLMLVAITGYGTEEDKQRSLVAGFNYHLTKPVEPQELIKILNGCQEPIDK